MDSASEALAMLLALLLSEGWWVRPCITAPGPRLPHLPENLSVPPELSPSQDHLSLLPDLTSTPRIQLAFQDVIFFFTGLQITGAMAPRKQATS